MPMFIRVDVDHAGLKKADGAAKQIVEVCPVKIFAAKGADDVDVVEDNVDECTLCDLCMKATSAVKVVKLYE